ncbi:unnamed protein product [Brachionus calyciflorus]|uniref:Arrestin C-terminal-like domain-containing protein n=1 Tax=Brachionus calyciflorus TaxID=104777 RepID=A0A813W001_9BILA|nr:unnamed protein product [Brachionus calyciflorus]
MKEIKHFEIKLDKAKELFYAGERVKGAIELILYDTIKLKSISLRINGSGKIEYEREACIERFELKKYLTKTITIFSRLDLNSRPKLREPGRISDDRIIFNDISPIFAELKIKKRGFIPNENIDFEVLINNKSNKELKELSVSLIQCVKSFRGLFTDSKVVSSINYKNRLEDNLVKWNGSILVPLVCPTSETTRIMEVSYQVELKFGILGSNKNLIIPITIGSISYKNI